MKAYAALQYILAQPEVSTVIPGPKTVAQARDNFAASGEGLPATVVAAIRAMWEKELADDPLPW
jgi:aryl-alcohol dehydrogenase-like predicted oxidoreductase